MTDIMIVRNRQLFAHTYLDRLLLDAGHDTEALALTRQIAAWAPCWDTTSPQCALDTIVLTTLDTLEFGHSQDSEDARCHLLYADATAVSPLGTLYAAPPGANLDDTTVGSHWMFLAVHAARRHQRRWALLTNGLTWRLLDADHQTPYEVYLELDLGVLRDGRQVPAELARALWSYLRRDAWLPGDEGKSGLDAQDEASRAATQALEEHLRGQIESVLGNICRGFIDGDGRSSYTDRDRRAIFDSATVAIYRMLFTLYAEARGLLPTDHPGYSEQSMRTLVNRAVALQRDLANPQGTSLWEGLKRLWGWIDRGNPEIGVAPYNGGLFSNDRDDDLGHDLRVLRSQTISDAHLSRALVDLATLSEGDARLLIDYRDLSVRHLGTLYEGILDHKLFIVEEPTLARQTKKGVQYLLAKGATQLKTDRLLEVGEVYFAQAPDERKATGSFYTPEYIVDYIVRHTVRTGLDERWQAFVPSLRGMAPEERGPALAAFIERQVLTFRVCDPAMGSGHFLVNAAHTITAFIVETLNAAGAGEGGPDSDPTRWRRRVVGSCLYGVDINPLAVELAKLSLWLATVERGRPLSFLDHHLRCGNSLIGARLEELPVSGAPLPPAGKRGAQVPQGQLSFYDIPAVRASMQKAASGTLALEADPEDSPDDVHGKATRYQALRGALIRRYGLIADLAVARRLGLDLDEDSFRRLVRNYLDSDEGYVPRFAEGVTERAAELARKHQALHWELEFPQVFASTSGSSDGAGGGFNAVVGNPPWGGGVELHERDYFRAAYTSARSRSIDPYTLFIEAGLRQLRRGSVLSYIVPDSLLRKDARLPIRRYLLDRTTIRELAETGPVFPEVRDIWCLIITVLRRTMGHGSLIRHRQISRFVVAAEERLEKLKIGCWDRDTAVPQSLWCETPRQIIGHRATALEQSIIAKMEIHPSLGTLTDRYVISRGEEGSKSALIARSSGEFRMITPEHVERYRLSEGLRVSVAGLAPGKVRNIYTHPKLWIIRIQKMRWQQRLVSAVDTRIDSCGMKTLQVVTSALDSSEDLYYLQAILASRLINFWCVNYLADDMNKTYLGEVPIPTASNDVKIYHRLAALSEGLSLLVSSGGGPIHQTDGYMPLQQPSEMNREVDALVYRLYQLTTDEIAAVESGG